MKGRTGWSCDDLDRILDAHAVCGIVVDEIDEGPIDLVEVERRPR